MKDGDVVLLQNTRFRGRRSKATGSRRSSSARNWLILLMIYVCDAFGSSHRAHASVAGVTKFISAKGGVQCSWLLNAEGNRLP